jgi:large subunit ribosomal protein L10
MAKAEKVEKVADIKERIAASQALLLTDYRGITVSEAKELRESLRDADTRFAVVKNTLMKRAAADAGVEGLDDLLVGPTGVAFVGGDAVLAAKRLADIAKKMPALIVKGGFMEGRVLSADDAKALAELESREVMLSKIAGMMKSQMSRAAGMFASHQSRFVGLLEALRDKLPATEVEEVAEAIAEAVEEVEELGRAVVTAEVAEELIAEGAEPEVAAEVGEAIAEQIVTEEVAEAIVAEALVETVVEAELEAEAEEVVQEAEAATEQAAEGEQASEMEQASAGDSAEETNEGSNDEEGKE